MGEKNKNTNHHPKCTCYFPSGVRNWIALESRGNVADGLGLELVSPQAVGREVDLAQGAGLCEGWWALPGPINGVLEEPSPPSDACCSQSSCVGCPCGFWSILGISGSCSQFAETLLQLRLQWYPGKIQGDQTLDGTAS